VSEFSGSPNLKEKKIINKQSLIHLGIGFIICMVILYPFFSKNLIYSHDDFAFHRNRLESYYDSVHYWNFFPKVFPNMANGYGYAADLFYPSILMLPYVFLRTVGLSFIQSYYGYMFIIAVSTYVVSYFSIKTIFKDSNIAFLFSVIYTTSTYRLLDQFLRGALGETLAFIFLPIVFLGLFQVFFEDKNKWITLAVSMALLIHSHMITSLIVTISIGLFFIYQFFSKKITAEIFMNFIKAIVLSFLLCLYIFVPIIEQNSKIAFNYINNRSIWPTGLNYSFNDLINNSLGNYSGNWENLKPGLGTVLILFIIIGLVYFSQSSKGMKCFYLLGILFAIVATNLFPWVLFKKSYLAFIQFPWRILSIATFFLSLSLSFFIRDLNLKTLKWQIPVVVTIILLSFTLNTLNNFETNQVPSITNKSYSTFSPQAIGGGREYLPIDTDFDAIYENKENEITQPYGVVVREIKKEFNSFYYTTNVEPDLATITLPKIAYEGYDVLIDGKQTDYLRKDGLLAFHIEKGFHNVKVTYAGTILQKSTLTISLFVWLSLLALTIKRQIKILKKPAVRF
jgi:hypothetical protein